MFTKRILPAMIMLVLILAVALSSCTATTTTTAPTTTNMTSTTTTATTVSTLNPIINMESLWPVTTEIVSPSIVIKSTMDVNEHKDTYLFNLLKNKFNLDFKVTAIPVTAWPERFSLMVNTRDMPDAILNGETSNDDIMKYFAEGELAYDMTTDIQKYAPDMLRAFAEMPDMKAASTFNNKILSLPAFVGAYGSPPQRDWVRSDWLNELGIEKPTNLDDFKKMLIAFRDNDPNGNGKSDEIPWGGSWNEGMSEKLMIISSFGYIGGDTHTVFYKDYTDTPQYAFFPLTDKYYDYLKFMNDCWSEDLIDPDMFTQNNVAFLAKVSENIVGVASEGAQYTLLPDDKPASYKDYIYTVLTPMSEKPGGKGFYQLGREFGSGFFTISAESEYADVLVRFANLCYAWPTIGVLGYPGAPYGSEFDIMPDHQGAFKWNGKELNWPQRDEKLPAETTWSYMRNYIGATVMQWGFARMTIPEYLKKEVPQPDISFGYWPSLTGPVNKNPENWTYQLAEIMYDYGVRPLPALTLDSKNTERAIALGTPIYDYIRSMQAKFITGAEPLTNFDAFVKQLKSLGAEELATIYSNAYNAYLDAKK